MQERDGDRRPGAEDLSVVSCFWCERLHPGAHLLSVCPLCLGNFAILRSLEMTGPYPLTDDAIDETLTRTSPGNYALGYLDGETFRVFYVGRSDSDVRRRLHEWVDTPARYDEYASTAKAPWALRRGSLDLDSPMPGRVTSSEDGYTRFAYTYARSADDAYARQWRNYDAFGGRRTLDNEAQPVSTPA